jgi:hypothetical protein
MDPEKGGCGGNRYSIDSVSSQSFSISLKQEMEKRIGLIISVNKKRRFFIFEVL